MKLIPASDSSLLVVFGDCISRASHSRVIAMFRALSAQPDPRIRNLHPGYATLLIDFDSLELTHDELMANIQTIANRPDSDADVRPEVVTIPVCYDLEFGSDLADVARHTRLSVEEVVRLHCSAKYFVCFLGFTPGFAYLGGLPEILQIPRLATPRTSTLVGSVGIAGVQTGIYPVNSAGGWRLIGRTPWRMFEPNATPPTRLLPGDSVQFSAIDRATFDQIHIAEWQDA